MVGNGVPGKEKPPPRIFRQIQLQEKISNLPRVILDRRFQIIKKGTVVLYREQTLSWLYWVVIQFFVLVCYGDPDFSDMILEAGIHIVNLNQGSVWSWGFAKILGENTLCV